MIDQDEYLGLKAMRKSKSLGDFSALELGLKELLARSWGSISLDQAIAAFAHDLKEVLEAEEIGEMVRQIFVLENNVLQLQRVIGESAARWPNLNQFFRNLSPVLLQALYHNVQANEEHTDAIISQWVSAIRVAVEEEYYFWQEKLMDSRVQ